MKNSLIIFATAAALTAAAMGVTQAQAQPYAPPGSDPYGYYSQYDHDGYYDRDGHYQHFSESAPPPAAYGPPPGYYREGEYESDCHRGNATAGTIFGALGGGLIGSAASHGNAGAVVGGAILGGLFGNAIAGDIDCDDRRYAFDVYDQGLNGDVGRRYEWRHGDHYGYFTPTREYRDGDYVCRDFTVVTYHNGEERDHTGTSCREADGNWHFR